MALHEYCEKCGGPANEAVAEASVGVHEDWDVGEGAALVHGPFAKVLNGGDVDGEVAEEAEAVPLKLSVDFLAEAVYEFRVWGRWLILHPG